MERIKCDLQGEWEITDLSEPSKIIVIEITRDHKLIVISQCLYIDTILKREGLDQANQVSTPLNHNITLGPNPEGNMGDRSNSYAQLLGSLQFLANAMRPDIAYAVSRLASYSTNPSLQHTTAIKRILWYLSGTRDYGIKYSNTPSGPNHFSGYTDAAYANADDCKSTTGYMYLAQRGAITWRSKKQTITALSSMEAEYVALSEAA